ncbi:hypothetical protein ETAE_3213 [Edwardsiella piscicida]|uniref:Uncharacterized protein n=1 Tax=Edwardsiella piscicida TaxID=1263550 RepID=A0AAU8PIM9_EDWPI|nr:hypothetical protein ETAE_3213 [Edwardsiella tarda EIB202]
MTTTAGFTQARTDTTTQTLGSVLGAFGRRQSIQTHLLLLNFNHVGNRVDHTTNGRSILTLYGVTDATQTQAKQRCLMFRQTADRTAGLSNFDSLCHGLLPQNFFNGFTTLGSDHFRRFHTFQTVDSCTNHVNRVGGTICFSQNVTNSSDFQDGAHCTTGDDTGTFRSRLHEHTRTRVSTFNRVLQGAAVQRDVDHVTTGFLHRFLDRCRNFTGFAVAKTDATVAITHYSQCGEAKNTATFNSLRYAIYRDQLFLQFASLFFDVRHLTPLP